MVLSTGFGPNYFKILARTLLSSFNERRASIVAVLRVWSPTEKCFGVRLRRAIWKKNAHCLWIALLGQSAMQWLPSNFFTQLVSVNRFDLEVEVSWRKNYNTDHILKMDVVTYYLLTEKLFLIQKYDFLSKRSVIIENVHKQMNLLIAKEKNVISFYFPLPYALKKLYRARPAAFFQRACMCIDKRFNNYLNP